MSKELLQLIELQGEIKVRLIQSGMPQDKARTARLGRLELCAAWARDEQLPSVLFIHWPGRLFPGASAFTLRIGRAMVGFRWYDKPKPVTPAIGQRSRWA